MLQDYHDDGSGKEPRYYQVNVVNNAIEAISPESNLIVPGACEVRINDRLPERAKSIATGIDDSERREDEAVFQRLAQVAGHRWTPFYLHFVSDWPPEKHAQERSASQAIPRMHNEAKEQVVSFALLRLRCDVGARLNR